MYFMNATIGMISFSNIYFFFSFLFQVEPLMGNLEYPINFERFTLPKSIDNIVNWMKGSFTAVQVKPSDPSQMTADGASNAIGSVAELEAQTRTERSNDIGLDICVAHQNERAGGYASGTHDFVNPVNEDLGDVLKKSHTLQVRLGRSANRMDVLREIMKDNNRDPMLAPKPGNDTRWNSRHGECVRAIDMMQDANDALKQLVMKGGFDYQLLDSDERKSGDVDRHIYLDEDIMILRQFEAAAAEAKCVSLFSQSVGNSYSYLLLEVQIAIQRCQTHCFEMHAGKSI